ncbi:MAG: PrsW family glutamic-type intramembrane protease [Bacteroidales bacterium]|nr:PrsW family glutamic-type intramembrane protease [Bacteroidales bacterium]
MIIAFGFFPVLLFLGCLFLLDSFKLVSRRLLAVCLAWGVVSALLAYLVNSFLIGFYNIGFDVLTRYIAPVSEELLKASLLLLLVARRRVGFMIDAAIYGFAIGTGFALAENLWYYIHLGADFNVLLAIVRGFGTAIMHGGVVAIAAMILIEGMQRNNNLLTGSALGLLVAMVLHSAFNHFIFDPLLMTLLIIILLPLIFYVVFMYTTRHLQNWLEVEFSNEVDMLRMIRQGQFRDTKAGRYLASLKEHFQPETLVDMYCFFSLYLELSIKAKRNLMLRENGFPVLVEPDIKNKLLELKALRKQIGKAGEMALLPLVRMNHRELWELNQLSS